MAVSERYRKVAEEVEGACLRSGREPGSVALVAVSKTVGADEVAEAMEGGATRFGENRPDQLVEKADRFPDAQWHFIGNIQSRRLSDIVGRADLIHSLYTERHADKIDALAAERGIVQDVLIEVNVSGEESKSGVTPAEASSLLTHCSQLPHVRVCGLMTMAPQGDERAARACFKGLKELHDSWKEGLEGEDRQAFAELSMGMSEDWPLAIEEGATIVRIGRAIFSPDFES